MKVELWVKMDSRELPPARGLGIEVKKSKREEGKGGKTVNLPREMSWCRERVWFSYDGIH